MNSLPLSLPVARTGAGTGWAVLAYFLLFPGFFAYHSLLGLGQIRAFLGGYFAPIAFVFAPGLLAIYLHRLRRGDERFTTADAGFWAFQLFFSLVVCVQTLADANPGVLANHSFALVYLLDTFIIFKCLDLRSDSLRRWNLLAVMAMSATVFAFAVDGVFYLGALGAAKDPEAVATYQGFSRSYLAAITVAIAAARSLPERWLLYAIGLPSLYLNAARSEFVALIVLLPLVELALARHKLALLACMSAAALLLWSQREDLLALLPQNRMLELLDLSQSTSANLRHQLAEQAWQTIRAHPWLGDYGSYQVGYYAHNIYSAWVDLGLFGFVFLLLLIALPALHAGAALHLGRRRSPFLLQAWAFLASTLLLLFTSHYFADMLIGVSLGAYARALMEDTHG
ncbi:hypothetical protein [Massilia sp. TS11]|uniref:hypothetical protein n=1 Tax=Massilia sp. TS11 TaxID=2908003 RepID=UPI001ED9DA51|nr:hypothetical protein [Massilia sp. TS11]MCG2584303.1 hypothetical protein [Massilia sp. TS11]